MKLIKLPPLSDFGVNSFIIVSECGNGVLIDAPEDENGVIMACLEAEGITLKKILLTHGHCDHIASAADIAEKTGAEVFIHKADAPKLSDDRLNLVQYFSLDHIRPVEKYTEVIGGDIITQDELSFEVYYTPGHTSGCVIYILDDIMFCGDTLFRGGMGRVDMIDGSPETMFNTLMMISEFEGKHPDYTTYSGHGPSSTLNTEKMRNPYLNMSYDDIM